MGIFLTTFIQQYDSIEKKLEQVPNVRYQIIDKSISTYAYITFNKASLTIDSGFLFEKIT